jgi:DNA-binding winged helix-turn-helix (wHTH) protein/tetratricopeptide (TPR) repeat protein
LAPWLGADSAGPWRNSCKQSQNGPAKFFFLISAHCAINDLGENNQTFALLALHFSSFLGLGLDRKILRRRTEVRCCQNGGPVMEYRWDDYTLDGDGTLLKRRASQVDVRRKVLCCIRFLIEQRHRTVSYDELIDTLWGHSDITNHQLSQVILAARRTLGDDGRTQRLIRNTPGLGYRWIGPIREEADKPDIALDSLIADAGAMTGAPTPPTTAVIEASDQPPEDKFVATGNIKPGRKLVSILLAGCACFGAFFVLALPGKRIQGADAVAAKPALQIESLHSALNAGKFEEVRRGLATLPLPLAEMPDAQMLKIELDFNRGYLDRANDRLQTMLQRRETTANPMLHVQLLLIEMRIEGVSKKNTEDPMRLADTVVSLLDANRDSFPLELQADVIEQRAIILVDQGRPQDALRDLMHIMDLYKQAGRTEVPASTKASVARALMRTGRLENALSILQQVRDQFRRDHDVVQLIQSLNTTSRIQMELLRWQDALASSNESLRLLQESPFLRSHPRTLELQAQTLTGLGKCRLAGSQLEESGTLTKGTIDPSIDSFHRLECGDLVGALRSAQEGFDSGDVRDQYDILLGTREGSLLLWMTAAQKLTDAGKDTPRLSPEMLQQLRKPVTTLGYIASGRWHWSEGRDREAEVALRNAFNESRRLGYLFRMTLAAEPLIELLLERGKTDSARQILEELREFDPEHVDRDYRSNLLRLRVAHATGDTGSADIARRNAISARGERPLAVELRGAMRGTGHNDDRSTSPRWLSLLSRAHHANADAAEDIPEYPTTVSIAAASAPQR